ncbi:hypothetical protein BYT27DRAFT_7210497 [Phlegmacium glaucopus]|nr:hypothetical protein BYT27DRAFT_7210497 [Phlegmacium glaucopus]
MAAQLGDDEIITLSEEEGSENGEQQVVGLIEHEIYDNIPDESCSANKTINSWEKEVEMTAGISVFQDNAMITLETSEDVKPDVKALLKHNRLGGSSKVVQGNFSDNLKL